MARKEGNRNPAREGKEGRREGEMKLKEIECGRDGSM